MRCPTLSCVHLPLPSHPLSSPALRCRPARPVLSPPLLFPCSVPYSAVPRSASSLLRPPTAPLTRLHALHAPPPPLLRPLHTQPVSVGEEEEMERFPLIPILHLRWRGGGGVEADGVTGLQAVEPSGSLLRAVEGGGGAVLGWMRTAGLGGEVTLSVSHDDGDDEQGMKRTLIGVDSEELVMDLLDAGFGAVVLSMEDERPTSSSVWSLLSAHVGPVSVAGSTFPSPLATASLPFFIPRDRLALRLPCAGDLGWSHARATMLHFAPAVGEFILDLPAHEDSELGRKAEDELLSSLEAGLQALRQEWLPAAEHPPVRVLLSFSTNSAPLRAERVLELSAHAVYCTAAVSANSIPPPSDSDSDSTSSTSALPSPLSSVSLSALGGWLGEVLVLHLRSDRADGLYSTVVVDEGGVALGLVYSNRLSVLSACREQRGVYWSRSRQTLWKKGETSGACQRLLQVALDCDGDALRFTVQQEGAGFCHLDRWTCWPSATGSGGAGGGAGGGQGGLAALQRTLWERRRHPMAGSYTNRLLGDEGLLHSKLLEEARELVEATSARDVCSEAADLLYFTLVRLCKAGVPWTEVERCLDLRSCRLRRRAGNAKPAFTSTTRQQPPPFSNGAAATHSPPHTSAVSPPFLPSAIQANLSPSTHVAVDGKNVLR